jgi:hypothetical protein
MKKILLLALVLLGKTALPQPAPFLYIDTICHNTPGWVQVPVQFTDFNNVSSLSFYLYYDTVNANLEYSHYVLDSNFLYGFPIVNATPGTISFAWFSIIPLSLPDEDTILTITFWHLQDTCYLNFDTTPGSYSNGFVIPSVVSLAQQPQDFTTVEGQTAVFDVVSASPGAMFQWQYSMDNGITWFDIPDSPPFYGVLSSVLIIDSVVVGYDQMQFRAAFLNCGGGFSDPALLTVLPNASFNGSLTYPNAFNTPLDNTVISLIQGGITQYSATTDINGNFSFPYVMPGIYNITYQMSHPWGGGNASDALKIMQHSVGMLQLTGLPLQAADVNESSSINAMDALIVLKRFVGMILSFDPYPEWKFNATQVNIPANTTMSLNINALCTGDVDVSYIP